MQAAGLAQEGGGLFQVGQRAPVLPALGGGVGQPIVCAADQGRGIDLLTKVEQHFIHPFGLFQTAGLQGQTGPGGVQGVHQLVRGAILKLRQKQFCLAQVTQRAVMVFSGAGDAGVNPPAESGLEIAAGLEMPGRSAHFCRAVQPLLLQDLRSAQIEGLAAGRA